MVVKIISFCSREKLACVRVEGGTCQWKYKTCSFSN